MYDNYYRDSYILSPPMLGLIVALTLNCSMCLLFSSLVGLINNFSLAFIIVYDILRDKCSG